MGSIMQSHMSLMGKKEGMLHVFDKDGNLVACSVISIEPNVVTQIKTALHIGPDMTAGELSEALAVQGPEVLKKTLLQIEAGELILTPQDSTKATIAPKLSKEDGKILWEKPAKEVYAHIRGVTPAPGAWTLFSINDKPKKRLGIRRARLFSESGHFGSPGTLIARNQEVLVACGEGALKLIEVQPEGKALMDSKSFLNGYLSFNAKLIF